MIGVEVRTVVVGHRVVEIELEVDDRPRSLGLSVRIDGDKRWSSEEPGWRDIAVGVDEGLFVWSARRLVVVPLSVDVGAFSIDSQLEDLEFSGIFSTYPTGDGDERGTVAILRFRS